MLYFQAKKSYGIKKSYILSFRDISKVNARKKRGQFPFKFCPFLMNPSGEIRANYKQKANWDCVMMTALNLPVLSTLLCGESVFYFFK